MARIRRTDTLTAKQARFVAEFVAHLDATKAAKAAGYSPRSARRIGSELLALPHVKAEVQKLEQAQLDRAGIDADLVLQGLKNIATFDVAQVYEWVEIEKTYETFNDFKKAGLAQRYKCGCTILVQTEEMLGKGCGVHGADKGYVFPLTGIVQERRMKHPAEWPKSARLALAGYDTVVRNVTAGDGLVDHVLKIKMNDRIAALEMLAKHLGLLVNKEEHDINMTISWLPPEPPPDLEVETIDSTEGTPQLEKSWQPPPLDPQEKMGFPPAPPGPPHRADAQIFSGSGGPGMAEVGSGSGAPMDELVRSEQLSGVSQRALQRMFPELRKPKG